ncbi:hypothetical protein LINGRAHAP2_LOCUS11481 [Linum grandiflorum]
MPGFVLRSILINR